MPALQEFRKLLEPGLQEPEGLMHALMSLDNKEHRVRLVSPRPQLYPAPEARLGLFNLLPTVPRRGGDPGILFNLTDWDFAEDDPERPASVPLELRVADAVAIAGLQAADTGRRRAVLLVLGGPFEDRSRFDPAAVRAYLASLGVPLYVWNLKDPFPAWEAESFAHGLKVDLNLQRILWVEGRHLAREVRLAPEVAGLELLAR